MLFGAYAGFKLLVPAGPAIVGTGLGGFDARLAVAAVPVFFAAWITGLLFARRFETAPMNGAADARGWLSARVLAPLAIIIGLLVLGFGLQSYRHAAAPASVPAEPQGRTTSRRGHFAAAAIAGRPRSSAR